MKTMIQSACSVALVMVLGALCSGCVAFGAVDKNAATIDDSVGAARNNSVLANIVRASKHEPLYFYSISKVSGAGSEDLKFSFPAFVLGPHQPNIDYTFGVNGLNVLDSNHSGNFDVAPLQSKDFYSGMLTPLDLAEVNILLRQGYPRELVYRLAIDDVTIYDATGLHRYRNDPSSAEYPLFNILLNAAISHGVTTETYLVPSGGAPDASGGDQTSKKGGGGGAPTAWARLCFDPALYSAPPGASADQRAAALTQVGKDVERSGNVCGERPPLSIPQVAGTTGESLQATYNNCVHPAAATSGSTEQNKNRVCAYVGDRVFAVQLDTRSVFGIFDYLGAGLRTGTIATLTGAGSDIEPRTTGPLLVVDKEKHVGCFAAVNVGVGERYCVPHEGSDNLKMTFSIINLLQGLKTSPGDLPVTTAVRIEQ